MLPDLILNSDLMAGGWVIAAILGLSSIMWMLILDRYIFLKRAIGKLSDEALQQWRSQHCDIKQVNRRLRAGLTHAFHEKLSSSIPIIQVITAILPLLGLLGTVSGMIKTFEVMTVFGTGNVRGMAEGISQALITTMAGLLTALSGMYFASNLHGRIDDETEKFSERLSLDHEQEIKARNGRRTGL